jgi:hypothetical protein
MLEERRAEVVTKAKLESDEVILSAARQIRFDPRKLVDENGKVKSLRELDEETALALDVVGMNGVKVRMNRSAAREQLMKHLGWWSLNLGSLPRHASANEPLSGLDSRMRWFLRTRR